MRERKEEKRYGKEGDGSTWIFVQGPQVPSYATEYAAETSAVIAVAGLRRRRRRRRGRLEVAAAGGLCLAAAARR